VRQQILLFIRFKLGRIKDVLFIDPFQATLEIPHYKSRVYRQCKQLLAFHKQKTLLQKYEKSLIFPNIWMESINHDIAVRCTLIKNITLIQIQGGKIFPFSSCTREISMWGH